MPSGRAALSWGLLCSLALHALWLSSAPLARPAVRRAPPASTVELALVAGVPQPPAAVAPPRPALDPEPASQQSVPIPAPQRAPRPPRARPQPASAAPPLPAAEPGARDLAALERTLKRIAATSELSPDERRRAMLVVLRTWEDPARNESAEQLIDALLRELHAQR